MTVDQQGRAFLVDDVLDRYEATWKGQTIARAEAEQILSSNLDAFLSETGIGPGMICLGIGDSDDIAKKEPALRPPLLAACQARQHIAYSLHCRIQGVEA